MSNLQQTILQRFVAKLTEQQDMTPDQIQKLQAALSTGKKPKVEDVVAVFATPTEEEVS